MIEVHAGVICACLPSMRPLVRLILYGSFTATSRSSNQQINSSQNASGQGWKSRNRSERGDTIRQSNIDHFHDKPNFRTQINSVPHAAVPAQTEEDVITALPKINVRQDIAVDIVELGNLRFASRGHRHNFDAESASEKSLLR